MSDKAAIENDFARNRDLIDLTFQEEVAKLEAERKLMHQQNRDNHDEALADAGLNENGDEPVAEREAPDYFTRHRVTRQEQD